MNDKKFNSLKDLILTTFNEATNYMVRREQDLHKDVPHDEIVQDLTLQFPVLRIMDSPQDMEELIGILIADKFLPTDEDTEDFFERILERIKGGHKSYAHNDAVLALNVLSKGYRLQMLGRDKVSSDQVPQTDFNLV